MSATKQNSGPEESDARLRNSPFESARDSPMHALLNRYAHVLLSEY